jgi:hypothetical protein
VGSGFGSRSGFNTGSGVGFPDTGLPGPG